MAKFAFLNVLASSMKQRAEADFWNSKAISYLARKSTEDPYDESPEWGEEILALVGKAKPAITKIKDGLKDGLDKAMEVTKEVIQENDEETLALVSAFIQADMRWAPDMNRYMDMAHVALELVQAVQDPLLKTWACAIGPHIIKERAYRDKDGKERKLVELVREKRDELPILVTIYRNVAGQVDPPKRKEGKK